MQYSYSEFKTIGLYYRSPNINEEDNTKIQNAVKEVKISREHRGSTGGAQGEHRGSTGGAQGEHRGSTGGAQGEHRGSTGRAQGEHQRFPFLMQDNSRTQHVS